MTIHTTAIIDEQARIDPTAQVGPYCIIGPDVTLGANVQLHAHVVVEGRTTIGEGTEVFPFASLGSPPQDLKFQGEASELIIGNHNVIREHVTMNPGTKGGGMVTQVGDHCLFMVGAHVAHDCRVGNHVILANNATLAGHVQIGDHAIIGGLSAVHQFVRIGAHAMIGGMSGIEQDIIPYGTAMGERAALAGLNLTGLKRRGFSREDIHALRNAYKHLFTHAKGTLPERLEAVAQEYGDSATVRDVITFLTAESDRAICQPKILEDAA